MFLSKSNTLKSLKQPLRIISHISRKNYYRLYLNFFLMISSSIAESFTILSVTNVISKLQTNSNIELNNLIRIKQIDSFTTLDPLVVFIIIIIFSASLRIFTIWFSGKTASKIGNEVSKLVFAKILNWSYQKHTEVNSSILIATLTQFTKSAVGTLNNFLLILNSLLISIAISITLLKVNLRISISLIFLLAFSYLLNNLFIRNYVKKLSKTIKIETLNTYKIIKESLEGIKDVIINDRKQREINYFERKDKLLKDSVVNAKFISVYPKYICSTLW